MATYSLNNFLATPVPGDTTLKIYDISRKLRYEINPNIAYFFTRANVVIIRIEDKNDIYLDFSNTVEAAGAASKLNDAKKDMTTDTNPSSGGLSDDEQKKLSYFHDLSKLMTNDTQKITDAVYKSAHNVKSTDVWGSTILPCSTYSDAVAQSFTNSAITLHDQVVLTKIPNSNGQAWYYNTSGRFVRPWIDPVDIPFPLTNLPSTGFTMMLYRGDNATKGVPGCQVGPTVGAWVPDYYAGVIHFAKGYTPDDLGWGTIKATFFEYTGIFGVSGVTDAFTTVRFDSGTNELIFNEGMSSETSVIITGGGSGGGGLMAPTNVNMTARTTSGNGQLGCLTGILSTPMHNSYVSVYVNGVHVNVGDGVKTQECYFSGDLGVTARSWSQITLGDKMFWNGNIAGYSLSSTTDRITFIYLT